MAEKKKPVPPVPSAERAGLRATALAIAFQLVQKEKKGILSELLDDDGPSAERMAERIATVANHLMARTRDPLAIEPSNPDEAS
jgi:hypothetical protein